jgi:streptogramin lyase
MIKARQSDLQARDQASESSMTVGPIPKHASMRVMVAGGVLLALGFGCGHAARADASGGDASARQPGPTRVAIRPMSELKVTATIPIARQADWVKVTPKAVWIGSKGPYAVTAIDPRNNQVTRVALPGDPCAGLAADEKNLWVPLCGKAPKLARVDLEKRIVTGVFNVGPGAAEGGIAAGAGSVWLVVDTKGSMARIDPATGSIVDIVHLPPGSYNPLFSEGRIWVTRASGAEVTIVDAKTGRISGHVRVGRHPRFLTAGAGGIWTLNQAKGSLSRIDVGGRQPVTTLPLHLPGSGGDITYADGEVWITMMKTPLTVVDTSRTRILCQWKGEGGDAIGVGHGSIWLTNLNSGTVMRIALSDIPKTCRAPVNG